MLWFNGFFLGEHLSGYSEFCYDITDYVRYGGKNVLAVRVDATQAEGWFYEGAGIYRHVWLLEYYPVHIPLYGTYVTTDVVNNAATVKIRTKIINQSYSKVGCQLVSVLVD
jgi:beta-galactosidase